MHRFTSSGLAAALLLSASIHTFAADTLVWSEIAPGPGNGPSLGLIRQAALPGGAVSTLVGANTQVRGPNGVEFLGGRIWWPDQQLGVIASVLPDGTDYQALGDGNINPYDVDLEGSTLFWADQNGRRIHTMDLSAAVPASTVLLSSLTAPVAVDAAGGFVYWSEAFSAYRIRRANLDGTGAQTLISNVESRDFEVTDEHIYLTTTTGEVIRTALDGSGGVTLKSNLGFLNGIDVTGDAIFVSVLSGSFEGPGFTAQGSGEIWRMDLDGSNATKVYEAAESYSDTEGLRVSPVRGVAVMAPVPEPSTWALSALGLAALGAAVRRRQR